MADNGKSREPETTDQEDRPAEAEPVESDAAETPVDPLTALQQENEALREEKLRLVAETRNLQQRAARERAEALRYAESDFARELLVILDDLERTRDSAAGAENVAAVADGVRIVYEHFLKVLKSRNIEPIEAAGRPFDPSFHEAMLQQPSDEHPAGTVMQELARGYKMHERVLRPARVIVSSGPATPPADGKDDEE
ncbi:MAG: nucleotide exchange factor GrpE [Phycisphaerae bacterium]